MNDLSALCVIVQYLYRYDVLPTFATSNTEAITRVAMNAPENSVAIPETEKYAATDATANARKPIINVNIFILIHSNIFTFPNYEPTSIA
jgi:hypothetical protein